METSESEIVGEPQETTNHKIRIAIATETTVFSVDPLFSLERLALPYDD